MIDIMMCNLYQLHIRRHYEYEMHALCYETCGAMGAHTIRDGWVMAELNIANYHAMRVPLDVDRRLSGHTFSHGELNRHFHSAIFHVIFPFYLILLLFIIIPPIFCYFTIYIFEIHIVH